MNTNGNRSVRHSSPMRFVLLFSLAIFAAPGNTAMAAYPESYGNCVNDFADLLCDETETELRAKLETVERRTGVEVVVATLVSYKFYDTKSPSWEEFSLSLFNHWRVGNLPKNDGVLILVSKMDRMIRIQLGAGYQDHQDVAMKRIIDEDMVPLLREGDFGGGIVAGTEAVLSRVAFAWYYRWHLLAGLVTLLSTIIAVYAQTTGRTGLFWHIAGFAGVFVLDFAFSLWDCVDDGGGGGGASGDFFDF